MTPPLKKHNVYVGNSDINRMMTPEDKSLLDCGAGGTTKYDGVHFVYMPGNWVVRNGGVGEDNEQIIIDDAKKLYHSLGKKYNIHISVEESEEKKESPLVKKIFV